MIGPQAGVISHLDQEICARPNFHSSMYCHICTYAERRLYERNVHLLLLSDSCMCVSSKLLCGTNVSLCLMTVSDTVFTSISFSVAYLH